MSQGHGTSAGESAAGDDDAPPPRLLLHAGLFLATLLTTTATGALSVHPSGDIAPIRIIQGPLTRLNWPSEMSIDVDHQELYVTNPVTNEILVFRATDSGNVAPIRTLKGSKTFLNIPNGVFVDTKNDELLIANYGNHSATVYPRTVSGDVAPILTQKCMNCHGREPLMAHLDLRTRDGALKGAKHGPGVIPGNAA